MAGNEVAVIQHNAPAQVTVLSTDQLQYIAGTEFVPKGLRNNFPAILACVATGRAIGIDDMSAIRSIHIIDGKATFSAELMVMLVRRRGHSITGEVSEGAAKVTGRRADNGDEMSVTWTKAMAERAKLANKSNWIAYPEAMLWARAVSQLCRMLFADCFAGGTYTAEEMSEAYDEVPPANAKPEDWDGWFPPPAETAGEVVGPESTSQTTPAGDDAAGTASGSSPAAVISDAQRKRLRAIQGEAGVTDDRLKELVAEYAKVESSRLIPRDRYEALCTAVQAEPAPTGESSYAARAAEAQANREAVEGAA